ncbi:Uncharacterised protein [uncultured archaeon]|nr:Uncharacterised protein [uncultured archaeon]
MSEKSRALPTLKPRWEATCRVLFGRAVGDLEKFEPWLLDGTQQMMRQKSFASGHEITYAITRYAKDSKWMGFDEIDFSASAKPLSINEIKDIDSLLDALRERFAYAGGAVLGNSGEVERSSNITDSFFMYETGKLADCKYVAYTTLGRLGEDCFGCDGIGESQACVKCYETFKDKRCFELWMSQYCSDCYYSHNLHGCLDAMFCFNATNLRQAIGNLPLAKEKYAELKKKLLEEMAQELEKNRKLPSLVELVGRGPRVKPALAAEPLREEKTDKSAIEEAFANTCKLVLGQKLAGGIDDYAPWLMRNVNRSEAVKSALSATAMSRRDYCRYFDLPADRLLTPEEAKRLGESQRLGEKEVQGLTLASAPALLAPIAFFTPEYKDGSNLNLIDCSTSSDSAHCYRASPVVYAKYSGYCFWPRSTEHAFGCGALLSSSFCLQCHNSVKLARCYEVDFSRDCSGCYFSHNLENCSDCLFCFNAKNLKYAIGNVPVGAQKFAAAKAVLLAELQKELQAAKSTRHSIFSIGRREKELEARR